MADIPTRAQTGAPVLARNAETIAYEALNQPLTHDLNGRSDSETLPGQSNGQSLSEFGAFNSPTVAGQGNSQTLAHKGGFNSPLDSIRQNNQLLDQDGASAQNGALTSADEPPGDSQPLAENNALNSAAIPAQSSPLSPKSPQSGIASNTGTADGRQHAQGTSTGAHHTAGLEASAASDEIAVMCGPLLNYKGMGATESATPIWRGSVLIVTEPGAIHPSLKLSCAGGKRSATAQSLSGQAIARVDVGSGGRSHGSHAHHQQQTFSGVKLYADPVKVFWRFEIQLPIQDFEARWEYSIPQMRYLPGPSERQASTKTFFVPSRNQSMRIMFHSCNGFSVGTDEEAWSGPALWNDVNRVHKEDPFHVMIGGGDQIYNDGVRVQGPLHEWAGIANPKKRRDYQFPESLRAACDQYYFDNYIRWYSTEPFASANGQIPQINIWDDHDIIDGFGSYTDHFMKCSVFRGIGGVAHKYYMLFQHHVAPPKSTFTDDAPQTMHSQGTSGIGADPVQLKDTLVLQEKQEDSSFILGHRPGPYIEELSHSVYMQLGKRIAFVGLDARSERTRHQVNYPETYDLIFNRLNSELSHTPDIKHLIVLLGVPIAYPRLQWLENIFNSPIIGPIRFLNRRFGIAGGVFNKFDGQVDLLDDLDDHYTNHHHKKERRELMLRLQALSQKHSIRITILGGDVHLAALGRFYSNPKLGLPSEQDPRYMVNVVSSAITNKPPPKAVANLLARRNFIHHLDHDTDETMMDLFDKDPGNTVKTAAANHCTMPSRNYAILTESGSSATTTAPHAAVNGASINGANGANTNGATTSEATTNGATTNGVTPNNTTQNFPAPANDSKAGHHALHLGEQHAGTKHPAASGTTRSGIFGPHGLDVAIRVEINPSDRTGKTEGYGLCVPALEIARSRKGEKGAGGVSAADAASAAMGLRGNAPRGGDAAAGGAEKANGVVGGSGGIVGGFGGGGGAGAPRSTTAAGPTQHTVRGRDAVPAVNSQPHAPSAPADAVGATTAGVATTRAAADAGGPITAAAA
ncbi:MAG: hypothetical protein M1819_000059 [Sarea resinae]|nr:MAG: hypothetical protein M1819_000059 [Sarea resinae]